MINEHNHSPSSRPFCRPRPPGVLSLKPLSPYNNSAPVRGANRGSRKFGDIPETHNQAVARSHWAVEGQGAHVVKKRSSTSGWWQKLCSCPGMWRCS